MKPYKEPIAYFRMELTPDDFDLFQKVLKLVYHNMTELLTTYRENDLLFTTDQAVLFNSTRVSVDLDQYEVIKFLLNLHALVKKHAPIFPPLEAGQQGEEQDWYMQFVQFTNDLHKNRGSSELMKKV